MKNPLWPLAVLLLFSRPASAGPEASAPAEVGSAVQGAMHAVYTALPDDKAAAVALFQASNAPLDVAATTLSRELAAAGDETDDGYAAIQKVITARGLPASYLQEALRVDVGRDGKIAGAGLSDPFSNLDPLVDLARRPAMSAAEAEQVLARLMALESVLRAQGLDTSGMRQKLDLAIALTSQRVTPESRQRIGRSLAKTEAALKAMLRTDDGVGGGDTGGGAATLGRESSAPRPSGLTRAGTRATTAAAARPAVDREDRSSALSAAPSEVPAGRSRSRLRAALAAVLAVPATLLANTAAFAGFVSIHVHASNPLIMAHPASHAAHAAAGSLSGADYALIYGTALACAILGALLGGLLGRFKGDGSSFDTWWGAWLGWVLGAGAWLLAMLSITVISSAPLWGSVIVGGVALAGALVAVLAVRRWRKSARDAKSAATSSIWPDDRDYFSRLSDRP